jgi:hypothetical protein
VLCSEVPKRTSLNMSRSTTPTLARPLTLCVPVTVVCVRTQHCVVLPPTPTSMDAAFGLLNVLRSRRHFTPCSNTGVLPLAHPHLATLRSLSVPLSAAACNDRLRRQTRREPSFRRAGDELAPAWNGPAGSGRRGTDFRMPTRAKTKIFNFIFHLHNPRKRQTHKPVLPGSLGAVWYSEIG